MSSARWSDRRYEICGIGLRAVLQLE